MKRLLLTTFRVHIVLGAVFGSMFVESLKSDPHWVASLVLGVIVGAVLSVLLPRSPQLQHRKEYPKE